MKGKLIKISGIYTLMCDDKMIASDDVDFQSDYQIGKLSLKNCKAIANGYDLDELAEKYAHYMNDEDGTSDIDFKVGFQKALEILGDKKFSEEDMISFGLFCINNIDAFNDVDDLFKKWKSLQQTEWQVEVIMDKIPADLAPGGWDVFPKLDAENCLILKRVE